MKNEQTNKENKQGNIELPQIHTRKSQNEPQIETKSLKLLAQARKTRLTIKNYAKEHSQQIQKAKTSKQKFLESKVISEAE